MALSVPSYPNPYSTTPLTNAYAWISYLVFDSGNGNGQFKVTINPDAESAYAGLPALDTFGVMLGGTVSPGVTFPDLATILNNADLAAKADSTLTPFNAIRKALYDALTLHPKLSGATEIA